MRSTLKAERKQLARVEGHWRYCGVAAATIGAAVVGGVASHSAASKSAKASQAALDANAYQGEIATDQYEHYKGTYRPLEDQLVKDAQDYDSQANYDKAAGDAQATVTTQLGLAKDRLARTPGLDPSSAAAMSANADLELKGAAMGAAEQNKARENVKNMAYARKQDAVALGKGLVSNASSGLASATAGANAIAGAQAQQAGATAQGAGAMVSGVVNAFSKSGGFGLGSGSSTQLATPPTAPANYDWGVMAEPYKTTG
jgi:hypothetical protein